MMFERLLEDVKAGKVDGIVYWHPDSLYRRIKDPAHRGTTIFYYG